jgi:hypothetical protein
MLLALGITTPAAAQFGIKKKLKSAAGSEAAAEGQKAAGVSPDPAAAPAGNAARGGTVVLTPDVVDKLVAGLKAGEVVHQEARKKNTSYGRYHQALAAYQAAKPKCEAAQQTYPNRLAADEKMQARAQKFLDKMIAAQQKGDTTAMKIWGDSVAWLQDPSCVTAMRQPTQPNDYWEAQRNVDSLAEQSAIKTSTLSAAEWSMGLERTQAIVRGWPMDASASEKSAVNARSGELKPLLGIQDAPPEPATKPAPAPQPAESAAAPMPPGMSAMNECMAKNAKKHEKEIVALGERAQAAQEAGDMNKTLAIADTLRRLQMAGCTAAQ